MITRNNIIRTLDKGLKDNPSVLAMWLEGADVHSRADEYSDIDIWFSVEDGKEEKTFNEIKKILEGIAPVDICYKVSNNPTLKVEQRFFHLKNTSEFMIIDISIRSASRKWWFTKGYEDEKAKIIFDKKNIIRYKSAGNNASEREKRIKELEGIFQIFSVWPKKEIKRKNFLEAFENYEKYVLQPLVELLRLKFCPTKSDFYLTKISKDIPKEYLKQIEQLYRVSFIKDIEKNQIKAQKLFNQIKQLLITSAS